jgi:D-3-phosphoglycerate dehydrogenase
LEPKKVAILGARYGDLRIEKALLGPDGVSLAEGPGSDEKEILTVCQGAEIILCASAPKIDPTILRQLPHLKAIVRYGIGVDNIDLDEATRLGIYVANVPDYCINEVATHALALILAWARKLPLSLEITQGSKWDLGPLRPLESPQDLILGLMGFGRIARSLARMARGVRFQVWASDPYIRKQEILKHRAKPVPFKRLLKSADFLSLHLPLHSTTHHLIGKEELRLMKPTAYLINTARGGLVDERALYRALKEHWIAGAALDVLENEPWPLGSPLRSLDNLIATPHTAWYTERAQRELRKKACAEVLRVLKGHVPKNLVNRELQSIEVPSVIRSAKFRLPR